MRYAILAALALALTVSSCRKDDDDTPDEAPRLVMKFRFDSTQVRLDNLGLPATLPPGHAAQSPRFNKMSAHYIEFAPNMLTALGAGTVLYHAPETSVGGSTAIDFSQGVRAGEGEAFFSMPLSQMAPGTYEWLRVSLAYQNYDIKFRYVDATFGTFNLRGTVASFIGYNTYISNYTVRDQSVAVNANKLQGYWGFEVINPPIATAPVTGQAPPGATTVPNPLFASSPIPSGSCVVTGAFASPLTITGTETSDVVIIVSLSTNNSFEWSDNGDGIYEPGAGDLVVDMGVRGLIPIVQ
ncbi:MAG: hypothetical protein IPJ85_17720 [Flavobacteriales bacterium]|nr:hypothetical protein [Flavobacteriales bacterium]